MLVVIVVQLYIIPWPHNTTYIIIYFLFVSCAFIIFIFSNSNIDIGKGESIKL